MKVNYFIPQTPYLSSIIHTVWESEGNTKFRNETIIPKGIVEIIFDLGDNAPVEVRLNSKEYSLGKCFINGFNTFPIHLDLPSRQCYFGVQFHPVALMILFGIPLREFSNHTVDLRLADTFFEYLWYQLVEKETFDQRVLVITKWLENLSIEIPPQEKFLNNYLGAQFHAHTTVEALSKVLCYSPRHLSRKIYELTEMNTEEILLYKKYLHATHLIHTTDFSLTEIAYQSKFSDQSHFIRSFKGYTQLTPGEYRKIKSQLPGHIFENVR